MLLYSGPAEASKWPSRAAPCKAYCSGHEVMNGCLKDSPSLRKDATSTPDEAICKGLPSQNYHLFKQELDFR